jgi:lysine-N-methylase
MSASLHPLPVVQNWDCHVCGNCCKEYHVVLSNDERRRIEGQGWQNDPALAGVTLFTRFGRWWKRRYELAMRGDGSCIFLSDQGRCRIHERFGHEAKPLPCRLYPFVLVPAGDQWRVGMRFSCPSAVDNLGRPASAHLPDLKRYADELVAREGLSRSPAGPEGLGLPPPRLQGNQRLDWGDTLRIIDALLAIVRDRRDRVERRLRKCLALANLCRQARFDAIKGDRLAEFLRIVAGSLETEVPADPAAVSPPSWIGRVLFRQALALFARKDQGPNRGLSSRGYAALFLAACRFARGKGLVPKIHARMPDITFAQAEAPGGPLPAEVELVLERYYAVKIESAQFCGPTYFGIPFWEGLEALLVTFPVIMWLRRAYADQSPTAAVARAISLADDHFGFNRVLGTLRQRMSFRILARMGELGKLIAWYSR